MSNQVELNLPEVNSKIYKEYAKSIAQSLKNLNQFTNNLQQKVGNMLKAQQSQFVMSYKVHMSHVKQQLVNMQKKIKDYESKIQYYENQGRLSGYIKKVNFLQEEQNKLYLILNEKQKTIKDLKLQLHINQNQKKSLQQKLKSIYRQQIKNVQQKYFIKQNSNMESIHTFSTEVPNQANQRNLLNRKSKDRFSKLSTEEYGLRSNRNISQPEGLNLEKSQVIKLQKEVTNLKQQNRKLVIFNNKFVTQNNDLSSFFIRTVNQIKKSIQVKRKMKQVSFEDFKKQDKISLLMQMISNQQVLLLLYQKLFKNSKSERAKSVLNKSYQAQTFRQKRIDKIMGSPQKQIMIVDPPIFPLIRQKKTLQH